MLVPVPMYMTLFSVYGHQGEQTLYDGIFSEFDVDQSKSLSIDEFLAWVHSSNGLEAMREWDQSLSYDGEENGNTVELAIDPPAETSDPVEAAGDMAATPAEEIEDTVAASSYTETAPPHDFSESDVAAITRVFQKWDLDKDGFVDMQEMKTAYGHQGEQTLYDGIFSEFDVDQSNK